MSQQQSEMKKQIHELRELNDKLKQLNPQTQINESQRKNQKQSETTRINQKQPEKIILKSCMTGEMYEVETYEECLEGIDDMNTDSRINRFSSFETIDNLSLTSICCPGNRPRSPVFSPPLSPPSMRAFLEQMNNCKK